MKKLLLYYCLFCFTSVSLQSEEYGEQFVDLLEMVYGDGFLSQGGQRAVQEMVEGIELTGKKILDLGSGLGAPAIYLAERYNVELVGVDPERWMVERANKNLASALPRLKGALLFLPMEQTENLQQFGDGTFDLVFSKESILHVPLDKKLDYFREIRRVLKPGGQIVLMDWMRSKEGYGANTRKMMKLDGVSFNLLTPEEYCAFLEEAGFQDISMANTSQEHAEISEENLSTIRTMQSVIEERFGVDTYNYCLESWGYQRDAFRSEELITAILRANRAPADGTL